MSLLLLKLRRLLAASALSIILSACQAEAHAYHGTVYVEPDQAPELQLFHHEGKSFQLSEQRGSVVLLFFGYTHCPDVCPATLGDLNWAFRQLGDRADEALMAFVTVDPARDTLEAMSAFVQRYHPRFVGLRGTSEEIARAMDAYGIFAEAEPHADDEHYLMTHSARVFLIDRRGLLRTSYSFGTQREHILADLRAALDE